MSDNQITNLLFSAYWDPNRIIDYAKYNDLFDMLRSKGYSEEPAYKFLRENYVMAHDYFPWYGGACFFQDGEMYRSYKMKIRNGEKISDTEQAIYDANSERLMAFNRFLGKENNNIWARYKTMTGKDLDGEDDDKNSNSPIVKLDSSAMPVKAVTVNTQEQNEDESKLSFQQNLVNPMQENTPSINKIQLDGSIWSNPKQDKQKSVPNYLSQTITVDGNISVNNGELSISIWDNIFHYPKMSDADREAGYYYTPCLDGLTYVRARGGQNENFEIHSEDLQAYQDAKEASAKSTIFGGLLPGIASGAAKILPWLKNANRLRNAKGASESARDMAALNKDELVVADKSFLDAKGRIDWNKHAPNGGYVEGTKVDGITLKEGIVIDRYGSPRGSYTSPVGVSYEARALPYIENPNAYHQYRIIKPIENVSMGKIAPAFKQPGGGIQYELPNSIEYLIENKYLEVIN